MDVVCVPVGPLQANSYIVNDPTGTACCVDPGGEPERLHSLLEDEGLALETILLTHGHFDHLAGTAELARATGARVACSRETEPMLQRPDDYLLFPGYGGIPGYDPEVVLGDGDKINVGSLVATAISTPGHGPGDLTYEIGGALFCGDLLFRASVGRTDFPGGDFDTLTASVRKLVRRFPPDTVVYPGHMQSTTLGDEARANPFLQGRL